MGMQSLGAMLLLVGVLGPVPHVPLQDSPWRVMSYVLSAGPSTWSDAEARALLKQTVQFGNGVLRVGRAQSPAVVRSVAVPEQADIIDDFRNPCGKKGAPFAVLTAIEPSPGQGLRFAPFVVLLGPNEAAAFGDGVTFCLERSAPLAKAN